MLYFLAFRLAGFLLEAAGCCGKVPRYSSSRSTNSQCTDSVPENATVMRLSGRMTGDKFRARGNEYIKAANSVVDPVRKIALMDVAARWLRLAAQIDAVHYLAEGGPTPPSSEAPSGFRGTQRVRNRVAAELEPRAGATPQPASLFGIQRADQLIWGSCAGDRSSGSRGRRFRSASRSAGT